eukprot:6173393-Pleurochrysis_carterae.AAC.1
MKREQGACHHEQTPIQSEHGGRQLERLCRSLSAHRPQAGCAMRASHAVTACRKCHMRDRAKKG